MDKQKSNLEQNLVVVEFNCLLFLRPFSPSITVNLRNNNMLYH